MQAFQTFYNHFIVYEGYKETLNGLLTTVKIAVVGLLIGILIGTLIAVIRVMPKYKWFPKFLDKICDVYVAFFRGTPMVVQLLIGWFGIVVGASLNINRELAAMIIFGLNSGAYVSEIMRSGINSVDVGQMEAGRAVGLSFWTTMIRIVIPQALKNVLPTIGNEFITLTKETSVLSFIAIVDVTRALQNIADASYSYMISYIVLAIIYIILIAIITVIFKLIERRLKKNERKN